MWENQSTWKNSNIHGKGLNQHPEHRAVRVYLACCVLGVGVEPSTSQININLSEPFGKPTSWMPYNFPYENSSTGAHPTLELIHRFPKSQNISQTVFSWCQKKSISKQTYPIFTAISPHTVIATIIAKDIFYVPQWSRGLGLSKL